VLIGILLFSCSRNGALAHCHEEQCDLHTPRHGQSDHGRIATMVIIGDTFTTAWDG